MEDYVFEALKNIFKEWIDKAKEECQFCEESGCFMKIALEIVGAGANIDQIASLAASFFSAAEDSMVSDRLLEAVKMAKDDLETILALIAKPGRVKKRSLQDKLGAICDIFVTTLYLAGEESKEESEMPGGCSGD
ncbi:MAG: hypothetical protein PHW31_02710 [Candidatus Pacebacteria bacterium]|nr:hypothetical protein [Candidatus Paceibacterota bacterium]